MHEKIKKLSLLVDKLIEQNFKLKTENKSLVNRVGAMEKEISGLTKENQNLVIEQNNDNE
ncbi:hypothetical protein M9B39_04800 [SAR86 cluster bacterium]|jgi:cell division protein FtsB|nr:hypothetical protein M9B39_04800 [SAR86 cluster bacterium]|tara:strand:+ start:15382 stop:15561 length:180 start_codon:yes stop_codon:yes gene_type:complete